ncbi:hypothetical protein PBV87_05805 [Niameybacter massiliensis]|uniref:Alcohol acetyltransferase n=1 Tax=Holtiella tumoricola TaxID=3018743 RepID=A0AA42J0E0_9FIRM|nr:hypothetical protein [Holtiella tumoricola]MDA3731013.1 hypothetical protein [Holtiella tumoricola]
MKRTKSQSWKRLDNAAKIFPPNSNRHDTKVFRFSCGLKETINADALQIALDKTIVDFPLYTSIIRKGLFWYYFETTHLKPEVKPESKLPCSVIYDENIKSLLFEVTYYKNRINLEIYHALTDGAGALQFLRTLVLHYLVIQHQEDFAGHLPSIDYDASQTQREADSFKKYFDTGEILKKKPIKKAYKIHGEKHEGYKLQVINGSASVKDVLREAHKYNTTLTIFLCSILICAIGKEMSIRDRKYPIVLSVPVNLRTYFQSASARNFFSVINISHSFKDDEMSLAQVIQHLNEMFKQELTTEHLQARLNKLVSLERNYATRVVPLFLKKPTLRIAHRLTNKEITSVLSNIGQVRMPKEVEDYIDSFDVCVSTNNIQVCVCSYKDKLSMSFTSPFISTEVQKNFFRELIAMGIDVTIATNIGNEAKDQEG